ncbi:protein transport protein sec31b [Limosa lapponica baueri]|uniref:Protein transport protein sec31b n=1 Tax=Limosa lapponica baueri TaxID=1758121 RepID=A0A2I0T8S8_LIMLA|nr:protein transport protein sec31b [Limosa lapponica baueri]
MPMTPHHVTPPQASTGPQTSVYSRGPPYPPYNLGLVPATVSGPGGLEEVGPSMGSGEAELPKETLGNWKALLALVRGQGLALNPSPSAGENSDCRAFLTDALYLFLPLGFIDDGEKLPDKFTPPAPITAPVMSLPAEPQGIHPQLSRVQESGQSPPGAPKEGSLQYQQLPVEKVERKEVPPEHQPLKTTFEGLVQRCSAVATDPGKIDE